MIRKIQIEGLKALKRTDSLSIGRLTLLTGINGRGKSSFLQALLLLSQSLRRSKGSPSVLFPDGDWCSLGPFKDLINVDLEAKEITLRYETDATSENHIEITYSPYEENPYFGEMKSCKVDGLETLSEQFESGSEVPDTTDAKNEEIGVTRVVYTDLNELQKLQSIFFVAASRYAAPDEEKLNNLQDSKFIGSQGQNVLNVLSRCTSEQIQELEQAMGYILDGAHILMKTDVDNSSVSLYLDSDKDGHDFKPVNVGYGYSYIISLLLSAVLASSGETVIIENPEAHLHPWAESELMKFIVSQAKERKFQVILESHSDHIVNGLRIAVKKGILSHEEASILHFGRIEDKDGNQNPMVNQIKIDPYGNLSDYPEDFLDEWTKDMLALV